MELLFYAPSPPLSPSPSGRGGGEERGADAPLRRPIKLVFFKGGGIIYVREAKPLFYSPKITRCLRGGLSPLFLKSLPSPCEGEGDKGDGVNKVLLNQV
jgi:hypothetical protein